MAPAEPALLRLSGFSRFACSAMLSTVAFAGEQVVLGWLALELTNSPLLVGVALALRMAPLLIVGLPAGVLADRGDRLVLLRGANAVMALALTALGTLTVLDRVSIGAVLSVTFLIGCARALQQVTQQAHVHDLVGAARLTAALGALGIAMRIGGLIGALLAGRLIAGLGPGIAYLAAAAASLLGTLVLPHRSSRAPRSPMASGSVWEGLYGFLVAARAEPRLPLLMALTAAGEVLGFSHQAVLPSLARDVLRVGPEGLGAMNAVRQAGGIIGMLGVGRLSQMGGLTSLFVGVLGVFGAGVAGLGLAPGYGTVLLLLLLINAVGAVADVLGQSLMQQTVPPALRGRASGAWVVAVGVGPMGQLQIGALVSWLGVAAALGISGTALVVVAAAARALIARARRF
ncbi:MAG TPA: MFS transporter [Methylomirabilota bacterium]|jgi:MFS family permease|nr:MFS transporter [Methylomirabilota bacterium]